MVKSKIQDNAKTPENQGVDAGFEKANKINSSTKYEYCQEHLSAFGGLLALIKVLELIHFEEVFNQYFIKPNRFVDLGYYRMFLGLLMLLFIGFQRIGHFGYIRIDPMICGILHVTKLPVVSTFWRFLNSLGINQSRSILRIIAEVRIRVWKLCNLKYKTIHIDFDTTVTTIFGKIEGGRKGHNTKHRGKKALRPVFGFIEETREYIIGNQRRGETLSGKEFSHLINELKYYIPPTVSNVIIRGDGEFISWDSVSACKDNKYDYIFAIRRYSPPFEESGWYSYKGFEYNEVFYQPIGWECKCRFVGMRIPKEKKGDRQLNAFPEDNYLYRRRHKFKHAS